MSPRLELFVGTLICLTCKHVTKKSEQVLMLYLCVLDAFASASTMLGTTMGELH